MTRHKVTERPFLVRHSVDPLPPAKLNAAIQRAQAGDSAARAEVVSACLRLVVHTVRRYRRRAPLDELISTGCIALLAAIDRYDPALGRFSTIAVSYIRGYCLRYINMHHPIVRPPWSGMQKLPGRLARRIYLSARDSVSLNESVSFDDGGFGEDRGDSLTYDDPTPEVQVADREHDRQIRAALVWPKQTKRERELVEHRLLGGETLAKVGQRWGCSREYVRQFEKRLMPRIRRRLATLNERSP